MGRAHAPPRLQPFCRPGRRRGRRGHRHDGPPGTRGSARYPHEPARDGAWRGPQATETDEERAAADRSPHSRRAASATSWRWPRDRRRSATPCWIHPSPWRPGCSTTTRIATTRSPRAFVDGEPAGNLTRDHILDNITLYWLTGTGASAARSYWEDGLAQAQALAAGQAPPEVSIPVGFTTFPGEILRTPRSWVENSYPNVAYFNEVDKGGHFAAWEEPELFATEVRAAFRSLR